MGISIICFCLVWCFRCRLLVSCRVLSGFVRYRYLIFSQLDECCVLSFVGISIPASAFDQWSKLVL
jgi:hypothetical protein